MDCGTTEAKLTIDCQNDGTPLLTREAILDLRDGQGHVLELGGEGTCHVDQPDAGGDGARAKLTARCSPRTVDASGVGVNVSLMGEISRVCDSTTMIYLRWSGTLAVPAGDVRLRIDAESTLADGTSCRLRVGGEPADPLTVSSNVWLSFVTGPAEVALELDCPPEDDRGFAGLGCIGWTPGLPAAPVRLEPGVELSIVAEAVGGVE